MRKLLAICLALICISTLSVFAADENSQGRPPANVVVGETASGMLAPTVSFVGTVRYSDISSVAKRISRKDKTGELRRRGQSFQRERSGCHRQ